jgi:hypothetical protein
VVEQHRVEQLVDHVQADQPDRPVRFDQQLLDQSADALQRRRVEPVLLGLFQRVPAAAVERETDQAVQLGVADPIHAGEGDRLGNGGAVGEPGRVAADQLRAGLVVPQRHDEAGADDLPVLRQLVQQPAVLDVLQGLPERLVAFGRVGHERGVVVLARIGVRVGIGQAQLGVVGVVDLPIGVPGRPVVEVLHRLHVEGRLLVAGRRALAEALDEVAEGVAVRLDDVGAQLIAHADHPFSGPGLVGLGRCPAGSGRGYSWFRWADPQRSTCRQWVRSAVHVVGQAW